MKRGKKNEFSYPKLTEINTRTSFMDGTRHYHACMGEIMRYITGRRGEINVDVECRRDIDILIKNVDKCRVEAKM